MGCCCCCWKTRVCLALAAVIIGATADIADAFSVVGPAAVQTPVRFSRNARRIVLRVAAEQPEAAVTTDDETTTSTTIKGLNTDNNEGVLAGAEILDFLLLLHKPLGCTVEESLADANHIFVTHIAEAGFAGQAGLAAGDVVVGITDISGKVTNVTGLGIDKVKGLVQACPDDEPLEIRVARGTRVAQDHEEALVELCANPDSSDSEAEQCVLEFLEGGYFVDEEPDAESLEEQCDEDSDTECLLDSMNNMWAEELPATNGGAATTEQPTPKETPNKPKPWSVRSSPSGTFVRDPATGEMRNIDA